MTRTDLVRKLRSAGRLAAPHAGNLLYAYAWLAVVRPALHALAYRRVLALIHWGVPAPQRGYDERELASVAKALDMAARNNLGRVTCLPRSLVLCRMLRRAGYPAEVCLGVHRQGGAIEAHAWVQSAGHVVGDAADVAQKFTPLAPVGADGLIRTGILL